MIGAVLALLAAACFSLSNVLSRKGMYWASVFETIVWNVLGTFAVFGMVALVTAIGRGWPTADTRSVLLAMCAGLVSNLSAATAFYATAARLGASRASTFRVLAPLVSIVLGIVLLAESLSYSAMLGLALILGGLLIVTYDSKGSVASTHPATKVRAGEVVTVGTGASDRSATESASVTRAITARGRSERSVLRSGLLFGMLTALLFGVGDVLRKGVVSVGLDPLWASLISSGTALMAIVAYGGATGGLTPALRVDRRALPYFLTGGVLTATAIFTLFSSLERIPVSIVTPLNATQGLFAILFGWLLNGEVERVSLPLLLGSGVVVAGLVFVLM